MLQGSLVVNSILLLYINLPLSNLFFKIDAFSTDVKLFFIFGK